MQLMTKKPPLRLPWWFTIFAYILVIACILNGGAWCYLYSIQWGKEIALEWLASFVLSFFNSLLLVQPVRVSYQHIVLLYFSHRVIVHNFYLLLLIYGVLGFWGWGFQLIRFGACGVGPSGLFWLGPVGALYINIKE